MKTFGQLEAYPDNLLEELFEDSDNYNLTQDQLDGLAYAHSEIINAKRRKTVGKLHDTSGNEGL